MPERDYSHRSLMDKLGVAPDDRVAVINVRNDDFVKLLQSATRSAPVSAVRGRRYDKIFLQIDTAKDLERIRKMRDRLEPDGALWIFHPKGKNASVKDAQVRDVYLACGLVDNKISAYTDTHTATRCVIPVALRPAK